MNNEWKHARIGKQYSFCASHQLTGVPEGHQCVNLHGHNYVVEVEIRGEINPRTGFIIDFAIIDKVFDPLIAQLDHSHLNDTIDNPTAERIAQWFIDWAGCQLPPQTREIVSGCEGSSCPPIVKQLRIRPLRKYI